MNIGIFTDTYLPDINGVVTSVELLRNKLTEQGNNVYVVCPYKGSKIEIDGNIIKLPGIEIKKLYGYSLAGPVHLLFIEELKKLKLDIVHAETEFGVGIFANIVSSTLNIPLVRTYHTTYEDYTHYLNFLKSKTFDKGLKKVVATVSKIYCNNCVKLIAPSIKTANMLKSYGVKTDIDVIPTGIELNRFDPINTSIEQKRKIRKEFGIKAGDKLLLFVGRVAEEKSIDTIINVFKKVKDNNLNIKLLIVGDGPELKNLKSLAKQLDVLDYVKFAGKKPFDEVPAYYHSANGFISASTSETQGMTYIEALASGLMVIARYDDVLDDLIIENENGYFFKGEDDLFNKLQKFNSLSLESLNIISKRSIKSVQIYDSNKFGIDSYNLYKQAIEDYSHSYNIEKTTLKDDTVLLKLLGYNGNEEKLTLSLDVYYNLGFRKDSKITKLNYTYLKAREGETLAYRSCLRKLGMKDYSIREMRTYLYHKRELEPYQIDNILNRLIEIGLLNDEKFALSKINSFKSNFMSSRAMVKKLKGLGISDEIISNCLLNEDSDELSYAKHKANKYLSMAHGKSTNATKQTIYSKLLNDGFSIDMAKEAIDGLDFNDLILNEKDILRKEANKALKKYEKKFSGTDLRNRVYMTLVSKGFTYDNIYAIINEMEL